ncbi:hypothetical protein B0H11DRAFT_2231639 [Mycena galericulata]|nr:hypothetical protein B0H11DRAFT_2231639 [Mycena galericulata]
MQQGGVVGKIRWKRWAENKYEKSNIVREPNKDGAQYAANASTRTPFFTVPQTSILLHTFALPTSFSSLPSPPTPPQLRSPTSQRAAERRDEGDRIWEEQVKRVQEEIDHKV